MNFSDFLGNEQVRHNLWSAFTSDKFPHAIVLQGEKGCGKRSFAKLLAQTLVCQNKDRAPCGECSSCIRAKAGSHPDIRIEEGSGATRSLTVDTIKTLIADAHKMPEESDVQVYLLFIDNKMGETAQNKLLKIIEEPPARTVFIFTCQSAEVLLPTIRSRTQIFTLQPPAIPEAAAYVMNKKNLSDEKAQELAELCGGNIGKMLDEKESGQAALVKHSLELLLPAVTAKNEQDIFKVTAGFIRDKKLFADVLEQLREIVRQVILLKSGYDGFTERQKERLLPLQRVSVKKLMDILSVVQEYAGYIQRNANMNLLVTSFAAQLRKRAGR